MKSRCKIFKTDKSEITGTIWIDIDLIDYHNKRLEFEFKENDKKLKELLQSTGWDWVPDYPQAKLNLGLCEFDPEFKKVNFIENNLDKLEEKAVRDLWEVLCNEYNGDMENVRIDPVIRHKVALEQLTPQEGARRIFKKLKDKN